MNPQKTITDYEYFDDTEANLPQYRLMTLRQGYLDGKKHFDRILPSRYASPANMETLERCESSFIRETNPFN